MIFVNAFGKVCAGTGAAAFQGKAARVPCREPKGDGIAVLRLGAAGKAVRDGTDRGWARNGPARGAVGPGANCFGQVAEGKSEGVG